MDYYNFSSGGAGVFGTGLTIRNSGAISGGDSSDRTRRADAITFAGGANYLTTNTGGSYAGNISISNANSGSLTLLQTAAGGATSSATYSNAFTGAGGLIVTTDSGYKVTLSGANSHSGGTLLTSGFLQMSGAGTLGAATGTTTISGGTLDLGQTTQTQAGMNIAGGTLQNGALDAAITSSGGTINGIGGSANLTTTSGTTVALGNNTYNGATAVSGGILKGGDANAFSALSATSVAGGAALDLNNFDQSVGSLAGAGTVALGSATLTVGGLGTSTTFSGTLSGTGGLTKTGAGILTLSGANTYSGSTIITAGSVQLSGAGTLGAATGTTTISGSGTLDLGSTTQTRAAVNLAGGTLQDGMLNGAIISAGGTISDIGGTASLTTTSGTTVVLGSNAYGGATAVNGGVLEVDGAITGTSHVTVGSGGMLTGTGLVDPLLVTISAGGALAPGAAGVPGTAMTIEGNLAFQSGALYVVHLNPTATTFAKVTGTTSLAGTVQANFAPGSYLTRQYVILQSSGLSGSFSDLVTANLPGGFAASLAYSGTDVLLNLFAALPPDNLNLNQRNVATGINSYFNSGGALPPRFITVFRLTGGALANVLTQLDGEAHTGAQQGAFQLTSEFLELTLDPFVQGRSFAAGAPDTPLGFAPNKRTTLPSDLALAYAATGKTAAQPSFDQRWSSWTSAYGGSSTTSGNAAVGASNLTAKSYGFATGMDYRLAPTTLVGFALAGAGTNWGLANVLGTGRSDALQAGIYGMSWFGPAYVGGSLAFTNHWFTTSRTALGDQLSASFVGQSYGARLEAGYRLHASPAFAVTPYGAMQFQALHTPAYGERDLSGGGFGLAYAARTATDIRTEMGVRFDAPTHLFGQPLTFYGRLAWAHDFASTPALSAAFQALPGSAFIVDGAAIPRDTALTTAGAQLALTPNLSVAAKFDGTFAGHSQTYAGSSTLRYTW